MMMLCIYLVLRSPIIIKKLNFFTHHGPVCIKNKFLLNYNKLKDTNLQLAEDNEWLKFLQNGFKIKSILVKNISQGN